MKQAENQLRQELNHEPTDKEIADKLEIPLEKISELKKLSQQKISLDSPLDSESNAIVADTIADKSMIPEEQLIHNETEKDSQLLKDAFLKTLYSHERIIYHLRKEKQMKTTDVAKKLNVGRDRIVTIEKNIEDKHILFFQSEEYDKYSS